MIELSDLFAVCRPKEGATLMSFNLSSEWPRAATIERIFTEEIEAAGGTVSDVVHTRDVSFMRSLLPFGAEVQPRDQVKPGVALRSTQHDVWIHPYVFRKVCSNGAVMAWAIESHQVTEVDLRPSYEVELQIAHAIRACCAKEAFEGAVAAMRTSTELSAEAREAMEVASMLLSMLRTTGNRSHETDRRLMRL